MTNTTSKQANVEALARLIAPEAFKAFDDDYRLNQSAPSFMQLQSIGSMNAARAKAAEFLSALSPPMTNDAPAQASVEAVIDQASRLMAAGWRGNPNMSGDDRDFMSPSMRRKHDDKVREVVEFVLAALSPPPTVGAEDEAGAGMAEMAEIARIVSEWRHGPMLSPEALRQIAAYTRPSPSAVEVKGLVWNEYETEGEIDRWDAETALGTFYEISTEFDGYHIAHDHTHWTARLDTPDAAKAAAQADYEQRVRSCISSEKGGV
ncbi:MAG: hypothetical protein J0I42_15200 [Bosea sp.]|uniref:hypothetical protein n=1 Tax=Bosea sp. (in: a-proteobacteria) TaxID=1871050 RepID=UPI001AC9C7DB|nr:hypothetical protein [Bosea sp. (in: a-proteobacteria)]MBN9453294.1 hypothetical protein [Bosea sp. (in: a-proteobacteria)]